MPLTRYITVAYFRPQSYQADTLNIEHTNKIYTYNTNDNHVSPWIPVLQCYHIYTILHKNQKYMYRCQRNVNKHHSLLRTARCLISHNSKAPSLIYENREMILYFLSFRWKAQDIPSVCVPLHKKPNVKRIGLNRNNRDTTAKFAEQSRAVYCIKRLQVLRV